MPNEISISVVISTCDRASLLSNCIRALEYQTYTNFEVLVVCGPCSDDTALVIAPYEAAGAIRVLHCEQKNLSKARNIGIEASAGEVVAFIDDDSIAHPNWLKELAEGYTDSEVGGVGGLVYDHNGRRLQYRYSTCFRNGQTKFDIARPLDVYSEKGANPFLYLQGTNASFRRSCLVDIGGFSVDFPYFHDETDLCLHLIDKGYRLQSLDSAAVYHKFSKSGIRTEKRIVTDPYLPMRSQHVFALRNGQGLYADVQIMEALQEFAGAVSQGGWQAYYNSHFTNVQLNFYLQRAEKGKADGLALGKTIRTKQSFSDRDERAFCKFPIKASANRMKVCFLSQEFPPLDYGGIGRFTLDLARGFAHAGHEVHVITNSAAEDSTDFELGVWVHRLAPRHIHARSLKGQHLLHNYQLAARNYAEVCRIHKEGPIDLVSAPLWNCESAIVAGDDRIPTVLTLMTSFKTVHDIHPTIRDTLNADELLRFERETFRAHKYVHALSNDVLRKSETDFGKIPAAKVVQLGVEDFSQTVQRRRPLERTRILFVGRLERRKGVDLLLEAARRLLPARPGLEFCLVGKDSPHTEVGSATYRELFQAEAALNPDLSRVIFAGQVNEHELQQHYADADVFCLPSRYESYGLVLLEAMAFGVPVIANNVGGMTEIVENEISGLLCDSEDLDAFCKAISRLADDAVLRAKMGRAARSSFEQKYVSQVSIARALDYYQSIVAEVRSSQSAEVVSDEVNLDKVANKFADIVEQSSGVPRSRAVKMVRDLLTSQSDGRDLTVASASQLLDSFLRRIARRVFALLSPSQRAKINVIRRQIRKTP